MGFRLLGDVAGIARVALQRDGIGDEAMDLKRGHLPERIHHCRRRIRHQQHVGFVNRLESADRGPVESVARLHAVLGEFLHRDGEVLHQPGEIAEPKIHDPGAAILGKSQDILRRFRHVQLLVDLADANPAEANADRQHGGQLRGPAPARRGPRCSVSTPAKGQRPASGDGRAVWRTPCQRAEGAGRGGRRCARAHAPPFSGGGCRWVEASPPMALLTSV
jgi:hypothetical protein